MIELAFALSLLGAASAREAGLSALREGRLQEAAALLERSAARAPSYEALVGLAVASGRLGRFEAAEAALGRALALEPLRREGWVERAGLRFLQRRYAEAAADLKPGWRRYGDTYAVDLFASALHLAGRGEEALEQWNRLRRPVLRNIRFSGLHHTRSRLVVPQLAIAEGALVTPEQMRRTRLQLEETGAFSRVGLRAVPIAGGEADVEVALFERHGWGAWPELAATIAVKALQRTAWLRYENLSGAGLAIEGSYRWQPTQPRGAVALDWPRPLGLNARLTVSGAWERPTYDVEGRRVRMRARGAELALRRVLDGRTVGELRWRGRRRTFSTPAPGALGGRVSGIELGVERRLLDRWRQRTDAAARFFAAGATLGSDVGFRIARVHVRHRLLLAPPEGSTLGRSVLAAQVVMGRGSASSPLDEMFMPGAASEMEYPLRAHRAKRDGVLGAGPTGRSLLLLNVEWRMRLGRLGPVEAGGVLFYDGAKVGGTFASSGRRIFQDAGAGLRLGVLGLVLRLDYGHSLSGPSTSAVTAGLGHVF